MQRSITHSVIATALVLNIPEKFVDQDKSGAILLKHKKSIFSFSKKCRFPNVAESKILDSIFDEDTDEDTPEYVRILIDVPTALSLANTEKVFQLFLSFVHDRKHFTLFALDEYLQTVGLTGLRNWLRHIEETVPFDILPVNYSVSTSHSLLVDKI